MTKNRIFPLSLESANLPQYVSHTVSILDESWLCHYKKFWVITRLPFKSLNLLHKQSMVKGLPVIHEPSSTCEDCITGKHQRDNFPTSTSRAKANLEIVHIDLCGPKQTQSIRGSFYFMTFIDDFSKKTWIYFIGYKSKTFSRFKEFKALTEK